MVFHFGKELLSNKAGLVKVQPPDTVAAEPPQLLLYTAFVKVEKKTDVPVFEKFFISGNMSVLFPQNGSEGPVLMWWT